MTDTIEPMPARIDQQQLAQQHVESARAKRGWSSSAGGLLTGLTTTVLETELDEHLGDNKHATEGRDGGTPGTAAAEDGTHRDRPGANRGPP